MRVRADSVEETTIGSPGTGNILLAGATVGNRAFSIIGDGNSCYYRADTSNLSAWEIGSATYNSFSNSLTRNTVFINSLGTTAKVNLTGTCTVYLTLLSREIVDASRVCYPLVTGALPGPDPIADGFGQYIMVPSP